MVSKRWLILLFVGAVIGYLVYDSMQARRLRDQVRDLQKLEKSSEPTAKTPDVLPPPSDLVVAKIPTDDSWFVGKYEDGGGVEIPFRPGERPRRSEGLTAKHTNPGFVGPEQCRECHLEKHESFLATAHYKTSRLVNDTTIDGNFQRDGNIFQSSDPNVRFEMVKNRAGFFQRVHFFDWSFEVPMEIIVGSSKMAQTYLYWHEDRLFQHNVTHITDGDKWINSPGFVDGDAAYARPIPQRCLDCHLTYFDFRGSPNHFTPESMIFGITCERCHGPGAEHVAYHREHPESDQAVAITNPGRLDREIQMEVCGQCHGGSRDLKGDALSFRPGDRLDDHYTPPDDEKDAKNSVHTSNQLTRLQQSQCFQQSEMTCVDCHDPHRNERGQSQLFSKQCMACHTSESDCGFYPQEGIDFSSNCVDCHMPRRPTEQLRLKSVEGDVFPPLRDHFIRIDRDATERFMQRK